MARVVCPVGVVLSYLMGQFQAGSAELQLHGGASFALKAGV